MNCAKCNKELSSGHSLLQPQKIAFGSNPRPYSSDYTDVLCHDCEIELWPCPVDVKFHYGVPDWAVAAIKNHDAFSIIRNGFGYGAQLRNYLTIHYFHRRLAETMEWQRTWDGYRSLYGVDPYSFRGFHDGSKIVVLVDETETPASLRWITFHELTHFACYNMPFIDRAWDKENKLENRGEYHWKDDAKHEADSEEQFCNRVATAYCGGKLMGRFWWRPRVEAFKAGLPMPDPFAEPTLADRVAAVTEGVEINHDAPIEGAVELDDAA